MKHSLRLCCFSLLLVGVCQSATLGLPGESYHHIAYWMRTHPYLPRGENPIGYQKCSLSVRPFSTGRELSFHICYENQRSAYEMIRITRQQPETSAAWCAGDWNLDHHASQRMIVKCLSHLDVDFSAAKSPKLQEVLKQIYGHHSVLLSDFNQATLLAQGERHYYTQTDANGNVQFIKLPIPPITEKIMRGKQFDYWVNTYSVTIAPKQNWEQVQKHWERDKRLQQQNSGR